MLQKFRKKTLFHSSLEILGNSNQNFSLNAKRPKQIKINIKFNFTFDLLLLLPVFNVQIDFQTKNIPISLNLKTSLMPAKYGTNHVEHV